MNDLIEVKSSFVAPHYIEELGCDGLTAEEVAISLNARADKIREKLRSDKSQTLKSLILLIRRMKNINGVEYEEFLLPTLSARVFVARYANETSDAYLTYLLGLEDAFDALNAKMSRLGLKPSDLTKVLERHATIESDLKELSEYRKEKQLLLASEEEPIDEDQRDVLRTLVANLGRKGGAKGKEKIERMICREFRLLNIYQLPRNKFKACKEYFRGIGSTDISSWYELKASKKIFDEEVRTERAMRGIIDD